MSTGSMIAQLVQLLVAYIQQCHRPHRARSVELYMQSVSIAHEAIGECQNFWWPNAKIS